MEVLLFTLLTVAYVKAEEGSLPTVRKALYLFGVVGLFLLGFTLLRVYLPVEGTFHMVNSSGHFPGQQIAALDLGYFASFNVFELFHAAQSYVFGNDAVRFSLPTYQYGTMLFGEYNYENFLKHTPLLRQTMQFILLSALIYPLGLLVFVVTLYKRPLLHQLLFAASFITFLLILKFIFDYPVICNTDFRYFVPVFPLLAWMMAEGLDNLSNAIAGTKQFFTLLLFFVSLAELTFLFFIIL
jgi:hypothetical protein